MPDYKHLFERYLTRSEPDGSGEWRAYCPLHEDPDTSRSDSASLNFEDGIWHCMGCGEGGTITALVKEMRKRRKAGVKPTPQPKKPAKKAASKPKQPAKPLPTEAEVRAWHDRLMKQPRLLSYMTDDRGLTRETIKEAMIGHDGHRYTIPIRNAAGGLVNIRRYDPRRKDKMKMINWAGSGKARIYGVEVLEDESIEEVLLAEGEWDRLVAKQMGLPAVTHTAGALTFDVNWAPMFKDKVVFICYDKDNSGKKGAAKAARILAPVAKAVYIMDLDIDIKGGDITDFFIHQSRTLEEFHGFMEIARRKPFGHRRDVGPAPQTGRTVTLEESQSTDYEGEPLEMVVSIAGKQSPPYMVPRRVRAICDQDKGPVCAVCPMGQQANGEMVHDVPPNDPSIIEFIDTTSKAKFGVLRELIGAKCSDHVQFFVEEHWTVEQLIATNSVEHRGEEQQTPMSRPVLNVGTYKTPVNVTARVVGRQVPSPKDQRGTFNSWHLEQTQTSLDRFQVTPELVEELRIFRPRKGQTPLDRCRDIAHDMAYNVTYIYGRPELHIAYDLVWHSILDFDFMSNRMGKGWLEMLVVGDTRTGKSEAAGNLARHYNAGVVKSCEGMSFAGLVGGAQQVGGKHWMVTWGMIPLNDRRLVVLDEVSGLKDKDVIENMSSIRSSGKAQLTKIATDEASARTRLIWISNPPDGRALREINGGGMEVIRQLVTNPEDIARFDYAMSAASADVNTDLINSTKHEDVVHRFTDDLCSKLVLWAWSRKAEQVFWMEGVEGAVVEAAREMGRRYVPDPPLVQVENVRMKLARIAVALAARTFSTDRSGDLVIVKHQHVDDAVRFLDMLYGHESFGYLRHSRRQLTARRRAEENQRETREYLDEHKDDVRHTLLSVGGNFFKTRDFEEIGAMDRVEAQVAVRDLLEMKMIRRLSKGMMRMEPALIELLREVEDAEDEA